MSRNKKRFTVGCDPEFFLRKSGRVVSAIGYVNGTKMNPIRTELGIGISYDNVALEFATPIARSINEFISHITESFKACIGIIPKSLKIDLNAPAAYFPETELVNPEASAFGCDPDMCAWTLKVNRPPDRQGFETLRSCGGHVHVGHSKGYDFLLEPHGKILAVRAMDCVLGLSSLMLDRAVMSSERRKLYGKAGCHRPTDYGIEYRTLSNFWLKHPSLVRVVHAFTKEALDIVENGKLPALLDKLDRIRLQKVINTSDCKTGAFLFNTHVLPLLSERSKGIFEMGLNYAEDTPNTKLEESWGMLINA